MQSFFSFFSRPATATTLTLSDTSADVRPKADKCATDASSSPYLSVRPSPRPYILLLCKKAGVPLPLFLSLFFPSPHPLQFSRVNIAAHIDFSRCDVSIPQLRQAGPSEAGTSVSGRFSQAIIGTSIAANSRAVADCSALLQIIIKLVDPTVDARHDARAVVPHQRRARRESSHRLAGPRVERGRRRPPTNPTTMRSPFCAVAVAASSSRRGAASSWGRRPRGARPLGLGWGASAAAYGHR